MIVRVAQQASLSQVDDVTVAVDSEEVLAVVKDAGLAAMMTKEHHASGSDRVYEVASGLGWSEDDLVVNVQGDEPLLPPAVIDRLVAAMKARPAIEMGTVSEPIAGLDEFLDPNAVKVVSDTHDNALYFSRAPIAYARDELPRQGYLVKSEEPLEGDDAEMRSLISTGVLRRHVGIYAFRVAGLAKFVELSESRLERLEKLEQLRWLEAGHDLFVLRHNVSIPGGVDTIEDLQRVEAVLSST
jgi:3-deoxy-manno-octulosonate cytidylyltransferase (CMP-KDO synthetase)